ncbi:MAG TPA: amino acid permease [Gemmatimonadaceae bacterium]|jgi:APA family basic amino acid/polyamine antiporter|nr:amino acid permease [Gemmatimonadaceae bacterium]
MSLFVRKDLQALLAEAGAGTLKRELGPVALITLGIGAVIGAGIFVYTGTVASQHAGPALTLSMVLAGIACAFAGICYAELASMIPVAGSAYTYAYATMGELVAWIIGWDLILEYSLSSSSVAVGWSGYAVILLRELGVTVPPRLTGAPGTSIALADGSSVTALFNLPAVLVCLAITALLVIGIRESARANTTIVIIKVAVLALFVIVGARYVDTANLHPFIPPNTGEFGSFGWSGILRGAGIIFFAYIGFDAVSTASQEAKNPGRDIPIGILVSLAICTVIYIAVGLVMTGLVPYGKLNVASPIAVAVQATGLPWLAPIINVGAICGLSSVILVNLLAQSRIFYSMSRDGLLPPLFAKLHPRFRTPHVTTAITGLVVAVASGLFPIDVLGQLVSMGTLLAFAIVCMGVLILRRIEPDTPRPFKTPGMPWVPIFGTLICLYLMSGLPLRTWIRLVVWLVIGLVIYLSYGRFRAAAVRKQPLANAA